jgi:ankyrin repeat protein
VGHYIVHGRAEFETTDLGLAAYEGRTADVHALIRRGIDWAAEGQQPLVTALYAGHVHIARELLAAGLRVTDETYRLVLAHAPELLSALPPRPELVASIESDRRWGEFVHAMFLGERERARALMSDEVRQRINTPSLLSHGLGEMCPLHYAARRASVPLLQVAVESGADVNALAGNGKSALRLAAETAGVDNAIRREAVRYLESVGGRFVPDIDGWWQRFQVRRGAWLSPA